MPTTAQITPEDIAGMVRHWLETPPEGYLGSPYGADVKALLQRPQTDQVAINDFIAKMRNDLPVLGYLPAGSVNAWIAPDGADRAVLYIDVAGTLIKAGGAA
jgi:hypothetical protein